MGKPNTKRLVSCSKRSLSGAGWCSALFVALLSASWPAFALDPDRAVSQYLQRSWDRSDGLPQSSVTAILQDHRGFLWVATFGGLARFDGVRFEVFNRSSDPGIPSDRIISLLEDRRGRLWIGTEQSGAAVLENGNWRHVETSDGNSRGIVDWFSARRAGDSVKGFSRNFGRWFAVCNGPGRDLGRASTAVGSPLADRAGLRA